MHTLKLSLVGGRIVDPVAVSKDSGPAPDGETDVSAVTDVGDFVTCSYSKREIVEAGKALAGELAYSEADMDRLTEVFRIAHAWRSSHVRPMHLIRAELGGKLRKHKLSGVTAARVKRMKSIRKKLDHLTLYQIQDIAGCRAIMPSHKEAVDLLDLYRSGASKHRLTDVDDYVVAPRKTGYRSYHLIFKFCGDGENEVFNRHRIEMQVRSQLQHAWATAVEAVGLYRGEDLKGGRGDADWLRFFEIMSSELAAAEQLPLAPGVPESEIERRAELKELNKKLNALQTLESFRQAVRQTENIVAYSGEFYLIQYKPADMTVSVRPYARYTAGEEQYERAERRADENAVLVEVDKMEDLKEAYPNYFLDVKQFTVRLRTSLGASEPYTPDLSWLERAWKRR